MGGIKIKELKSRKQSSQVQMSPIDQMMAFLNKDIQLFAEKLSDKQKESIYTELSILISAGVDVKAAFDLIEEGQKKPKIRTIINTIKTNIVKGDSMSQAFQNSGHFTPYEYFSLQIGEETGKIKEVLEQLALFFNKKIKQRKQFVSAISYPSVIVFTSFAAVTFMLYFIVPMFADVFARFGGNLPYVTQMIINFSESFQSNLLYILIVLSGIIGFFYYHREKLWYKKAYSKTLLSIPVLGEINRQIYLSRFCTSMALLISARVPLLQAIQLVKKMVTFYPIQSSLEQVENDILLGENLSKSLGKFPVYDSKMVALIKVGEEVNKLESFFQKLSLGYSEDIEHKTGMLSAFLEPIMIIFLGIVVGFILIAMYMPMFQLSTNIGG